MEKDIYDRLARIENNQIKTLVAIAKLETKSKTWGFFAGLIPAIVSVAVDAWLRIKS